MTSRGEAGGDDVLKLASEASARGIRTESSGVGLRTTEPERLRELANDLRLDVVVVGVQPMLTAPVGVRSAPPRSARTDEIVVFPDVVGGAAGSRMVIGVRARTHRHLAYGETAELEAWDGHRWTVLGHGELCQQDPSETWWVAPSEHVILPPVADRPVIDGRGQSTGCLPALPNGWYRLVVPSTNGPTMVRPGGQFRVVEGAAALPDLAIPTDTLGSLSWGLNAVRPGVVVTVGSGSVARFNGTGWDSVAVPSTAQIAIARVLKVGLEPYQTIKSSVTDGRLQFHTPVKAGLYRARLVIDGVSAESWMVVLS